MLTALIRHHGRLLPLSGRVWAGLVFSRPDLDSGVGPGRLEDDLLIFSFPLSRFEDSVSLRTNKASQSRRYIGGQRILTLS